MSTVKRVTVLEPISSQVVYDNTTEAPKLKVAAYARVSTEQDEQQSSYEAQVNYYNQYIRNNPAWEFVAGILHIVKHYKDGSVKNPVSAGTMEAAIEIGNPIWETFHRERYKLFFLILN